MEQWGFAVGIPLATLIVAIVALRRQSDKDYIMQMQNRIDDLKEENTKKDRRITYLEERMRELADSLARRDAARIDGLLDRSTIHKSPQKPNGEGASL